MPTKLIWKLRYGHLNYNDLLLLQRQGMVDGLPSLKNKRAPCEGCALGKQHREEFPTHIEKTKRDILELVHTDVFRPLQTRSLGGASYFLLFIDDCTKYTWVYF